MTSRSLLVFAAGAAGGAAGGALAGVVSPWLYVVGIVPLLTGIAGGAGAAIASLAAGGGRGRTATVGLAAGALAGIATFEALEDWHFRARWADDFAESRLAASGVLPDRELGADELEFYREGAGAALEREVVRTTGRGGPIGRWLLRAGAGIRLLGPLDSGRGLDVGRGGALAWTAAEVVLAYLLAAGILRKARSAAEAQHLDRERGEEERPA